MWPSRLMDVEIAKSHPNTRHYCHYCSCCQELLATSVWVCMTGVGWSHISAAQSVNSNSATPNCQCWDTALVREDWGLSRQRRWGHSEDWGIPTKQRAWPVMLNLLKVNSDKVFPVSRGMLSACSQSWSEGSMIEEGHRGPGNTG